MNDDEIELKMKYINKVAKIVDSFTFLLDQANMTFNDIIRLGANGQLNLPQKEAEYLNAWLINYDSVKQNFMKIVNNTTIH